MQHNLYSDCSTPTTKSVYIITTIGLSHVAGNYSPTLTQCRLSNFVFLIFKLVSFVILSGFATHRFQSTFLTLPSFEKGNNILITPLITRTNFYFAFIYCRLPNLGSSPTAKIISFDLPLSDSPFRTTC